MVKIELLLDESEALNAKEPTGTCLFQNETEEVRGEYTYLDAWFICLIKGLDSIRDEETATIDVEFADQPEAMIIEKMNGALVLSYFGEKCSVGAQIFFESELKKVIAHFIDRFKKTEAYSDNTFFEVLEDYCATGDV
ncbi:MAG: hypothetical protein OCC49_06890 [Fibrobacterales bacterium]